MGAVAAGITKQESISAQPGWKKCGCGLASALQHDIVQSRSIDAGGQRVSRMDFIIRLWIACENERHEFTGRRGHDHTLFCLRATDILRGELHDSCVAEIERHHLIAIILAELHVY